MPERILMAIDDSRASEAAVDYAATLMGSSREGVHLHLVHVEPLGTKHMSPEDAAYRRAQERSRALLQRMSERLSAAGVPTERVDTGFLAIPSEASLPEAILDAARDQECSTIALGRNALPWYRESVHKHPVDLLVHNPHGCSVWVVSSDG